MRNYESIYDSIKNNNTDILKKELKDENGILISTYRTLEEAFNNFKLRCSYNDKNWESYGLEEPRVNADPLDMGDRKLSREQRERNKRDLEEKLKKLRGKG